MLKITGLLCGLLMLAAVPFIGESKRAEAKVIQTIVLQDNVCIALTAASAAGDDASTFLFSCINPLLSGGDGTFFHGSANPQNLDIIAAASQRNGKDDQFDAPGFDCNSVLDPDTGDPAADDLPELMCSLDERDGVIDGNFKITRDDFAGLDLDLNQLHDQDGRLTVIGFVDDDSTDTAFRTDVGKFESVNTTYVCATSTIEDHDPNTAGNQPDEDCDGDGLAGDGAVAAHLQAHQVTDTTAPREPRGPSTVRIAQEGLAAVENITVVGEPDELVIQVFETTLQNGLEQEDCPLGASADAFVEALGRPEKTIMLSKVLDSDGTEVTGAFLSFETDQPDRLLIASGLSASLDLGAFGAGGPNIFCGGDETGPAQLTIRLLNAAQQAEVLPIGIERDSDSEVEFIDLTIVGQPSAMTLTAEPPTLNCDGVASAKVSAAVTTDAGDPVVDGVQVDFSVKVLGTANPLTAETAGGVASTTVVPLAATEPVGVPVIATVDGITASILVNCTAGAAPATPGAEPSPPPAGPTARPSGITGPDTGSGGFAGTGALSVWPALALLIGAMALTGARFALRRR